MLAKSASIVAHVLEGRSADAALRGHDGADRAAIRAVALGTLRWYLRLKPAVELLLSHPRRVSSEVHGLLVAGAHQLEYSRNAPEATVDAAVDATRILRQARASGLVNAVLRRFAADRQALLARSDTDVAARHAHPGWLVEEIGSAWPTQTESILAASNGHPPMVLRVDLTRRSPAQYLDELAAAGLSGTALDWSPSAVRLDRAVGVNELPGFKEGWVCVQDAGAQLAAPLLDVQPGMRVLDACAAPGGKSGHLLEIAALGELVAVDIDSERVERIRENLDRLGRRATVAVGDAGDPATFWDGRPFDRILVDAPCSATGVIRRHPDIKLLRRPEDIAAFAAAQVRILRSVATLLRVGGKMLYATCSLLPAENDAVIEQVVGATTGLSVGALPAGFTQPPGALSFAPAPAAPVFGLQLLPGGQAQTDGFYYACLEKTTTGT